MAEVVGIAAAALQFGEVLWKFKKLCVGIRDVPSELSSLIDEVSVLTDLLKDIGGNHGVHQEASLTDQQSWRKCFQLFNSCAESMQQLTAQLDNVLKTHKRSGSIRVYMKREELIRCRDKLERTKATMIAAQQSYSLATLMQQNALLLKKVCEIAVDQQNLVNAVQSSSSTPSLSATEQMSGQCESSEDDSQPITNRRGSLLRRRPNRKAIQFNVHLPTWVWRRGLQMLVDRSNKSIGMTLRIYNRHPPGSALFRNAQDGDWATVKHLLQSGHASPFDIDDLGRTLLYHAAEHIDYDACAFLLDLGIDASREADNGLTIFNELAIGMLNSNPSPLKYNETVAKIQKVSGLLSDAYSESHFDTEDVIAFHMIGFYPGQVGSSMTTMVFPSYQSVTPQLRAETAMLAVSIDPQTVFAALGNDQDLEQAFELLERRNSKYSHRCLLVTVAYNLGRLHGRDQSDVFYSGWLKILSHIIAFESHSTAMHWFTGDIVGFCEGHRNRRSGKYFDLSRESTWDHIDNFNDTIRIWIRLLKAAGADLVRYGNAQKQFLATLSDQRSVWNKKRTICYQPRYLTYGSSAEDWNIYLIPSEAPHYALHNRSVWSYSSPGDDLYGIVGQFWQVVESPELFKIPGSYLASFDEDYEIPRRCNQFYISAPCL